ncbi:MAG: undecaprenyl-phosphate glucose phosphotransferase [Chitinophagaceae bacterium]
MNNRFLRLIQICVFSLDFLCLNFIVVLLQFKLHRIDETYSLEYLRFWIWLNASWVLIAWAGKVYDEKHITSFENFSKRTMQAYSYWLVLLMLYLFFTHQYALSRMFIGVVLICQGIMLLANRFIYLFIRSYFRQRNYFVRRIIIIGYNSIAKKLVSYLEQEGMNAEIVGFCENRENVHELSHYPIVSSVEEAMTASRDYGVHEIYSTISPEQNSGIYQLIQEADEACIHFRLIPDLSYFVKRIVYINYIKDIPVLSLRPEPLSDIGNRIRKRLFDMVVSFLIIVLVLSWLIPLLGILIWLESPGPVFFKQPRTGQSKQTFNCLKFRSMRMGHSADGKQVTKNDRRLTRIGKFLRKTSLDEFPQFLNVFQGDMSIVGPRPHMLKHTDDYSKLIEKYMVRQFLKPGITGWAQVNGYRGETKTLEAMRERVEHDIWYIENWSLWLDLRIVFLTIYNVVRGERNAF